jgi:pilus assembly protein CpaE
MAKLLQFEGDVEVIGAARTGREAIELTAELEPDVVLMDINMPDMDGIAATEAIRQKFIWVQIVILSVQGDPNYMRRAMLAGARDFLTKPPTIDDLISAIRRAGQMAHEEKAKVQAKLPGSGPLGGPMRGGGSGKIIVVYSPKGGTGCTTLAANLAVAIHSEEAPVLLVDANLQFGDVAIFFNEQGKNHLGDLTPRVDELDPEVVEEVLITHEISGVKILAAPPRPEMAEDVGGQQLAKLLGFVRHMYPYVIVDTSSTLDDTTLSVLDVADLVVLITTQDIPSIVNVRHFIDLCKALGIHREQILFVMNRYDKRINIPPEKVTENLRMDIKGVVPLDSRTVIPAVNRGVPFMTEPRVKTQPAGRAVAAFAEVLKEKAAEMSE